MNDDICKKLLGYKLPSEEEMRKERLRRRTNPDLPSEGFIQHSYWTDIGLWPTDVLALSFPTEWVELDDHDLTRLEMAFCESDHKHPDDKQWLSGSEADLRLRKKIEPLLRRTLPHGGFIKIGLRSPKDSWWALERQHRVCTWDDVLSSLAESERIWEDVVFRLRGLQHAGHPVRFYVRRWQPLDWRYEFRCFVRDGEFFAVSQYEYYYCEIIQNTKITNSIRSRLRNWYHAYLHDLVAEEELPKSFVFDVYYNESDTSLQLVEFNPWSNTTYPGAYTWEELKTMRLDGSEPEFRVFTDRKNQHPTVKWFKENNND